MHRAMMTFQNFPFFTIYAMYSHPLVAQTPSDEPVLENRMDRCRGRGIRECETVRPRATIWQ